MKKILFSTAMLLAAAGANTQINYVSRADTALFSQVAQKRGYPKVNQSAEHLILIYNKDTTFEWNYPFNYGEGGFGAVSICETNDHKFDERLKGVWVSLSGSYVTVIRSDAKKTELFFQRFLYQDNVKKYVPQGSEIPMGATRIDKTYFIECNFGLDLNGKPIGSNNYFAFRYTFGDNDNIIMNRISGRYTYKNPDIPVDYKTDRVSFSSSADYRNFVTANSNKKDFYLDDYHFTRYKGVFNTDGNMAKIALSEGQKDISDADLEGTWTGEILYQWGIFDSEISLTKTGQNTYKGRVHGKIREEIRGKKSRINYTIDATYVNGTLTFSENKGLLSNCYITGASLILNVKNNNATLKGQGPLSCSGITGIPYSPKMIWTKALAYKANLSISQMYSYDESKNGSFGKKESGCIKLSITNNTSIPLRGVQIKLSTPGKSLLINGNESAVDLLPNGSTSFSASVTTVSDKAEEAEVKILVMQGDDTLASSIQSLSIRPEQKLFDPATGLKIKHMKGTWLPEWGGAIMTFKEDDIAELITYDKLNNRHLQTAKWRHFKNQCDNIETLNLFNFSPVTPTSFFTRQEFSNYILIGDALEETNEDHFIFRKLRVGGGFNELGGYRLEETVVNDSLTPMLDAWVCGKWEARNSADTRYNFKPDHNAVGYATLRAADFGSWFWTHRIQDGKLKVFLWVALSDVLGVNKYEVLLEKSGVDQLCLRSVNNSTANYLLLYRNDNLEVPERYIGRIGVTIKPILRFFMGGDNEGRFNHLFDEVGGILNINKNRVDIYRGLIQLSKELPGGK